MDSRQVGEVAKGRAASEAATSEMLMALRRSREEIREVSSHQ